MTGQEFFVERDISIECQISRCHYLHRFIEIVYFLQDHLLNLTDDVLQEICKNVLEVFCKQAMFVEREEEVEWTSEAEMRVCVDIKGVNGDVLQFVEGLVERYFTYLTTDLTNHLQFLAVGTTCLGRSRQGNKDC